MRTRLDSADAVYYCKSIVGEGQNPNPYTVIVPDVDLPVLSRLIH